MNSQADSQKFKTNGTEFRTGETGLEKPCENEVLFVLSRALFLYGQNPTGALQIETGRLNPVSETSIHFSVISRGDGSVSTTYT